MFRDNRLERGTLALVCGEFSAHRVEQPLPLDLGQALLLQGCPGCSDLLRDRGYLLRRGLELEADLSALAAKRLDLLVGVADLALQALCFPLQSRNALFGLRDAVAHA